MVNQQILVLHFSEIKLKWLALLGFPGIETTKNGMGQIRASRRVLKHVYMVTYVVLLVNL